MILSRFAKAFYYLLFSLGMMVALVYPLRAQEEPSRLVILPELQKYPEIQIKVQCSNVSVADQPLGFTILENGQAITPTLSGPVMPGPRPPTRLGILLDVTPKTVATLPSLATAIRNFNDDCVWSGDDQIAVWTPAADGQTLFAPFLLSWSDDRGDAANRIQNFQPATPHSTKLNQLVADALDQFTTKENNNILLILSDGFDDPSVTPEALRAKAKAAGVQLYGVLLPNHTDLQDKTNLQSIVGTAHYCESPVGECLNQLWRELLTPDEYILRYQTRLAPPFTLEVQVQTNPDELPKARAVYPILLAVQPVQLQIVDPPLGAVIPITTTAKLAELDNDTQNDDFTWLGSNWFTRLVNLQPTTAITRSAITMTQPITAQLAITWPAALPARQLASITYWLNEGPKQTITTEPNQTSFALPLGPLPKGGHILHVRVNEAITAFANLATAFVEVREIDEFATARIDQTNDGVSNLKNNLLRLWWIAALALVILCIIFFVVIRWEIYWANRKTRKQEKTFRKDMEKLKADFAYLLLLRPVPEIDESAAKARLTLKNGQNLFTDIKIGAGKLELIYMNNNAKLSEPESHPSQQCLICYQAVSQQFFIYDGNQEKPSYHGTYLNDQLVHFKQGEKLKSGDIIRFGRFETYTFSIRQPTEGESNTKSEGKPSPLPSSQFKENF